MPALGAYLGVLGWFVVVTVVTLWALLKCLKYGLNTERSDVSRGYADATLTIYKTATSVVLVVVLWPGLSSWAYDAWYWILAQL